MYSRQLWGAQVRSKILNYVRENGETTRKEIILHCGKEASGQLNKLVQQGGLVRVEKGVYRWQEIKVEVI
nr:MAG TPA: Transcriptional regulator, AbiEi antitoxin N-terminal domain [Caudoviricetes sp.]